MVASCAAHLPSHDETALGGVQRGFAASVCSGSGPHCTVAVTCGCLWPRAEVSYVAAVNTTCVQAVWQHSQTLAAPKRTAGPAAGQRTASPLQLPLCLCCGVLGLVAHLLPPPHALQSHSCDRHLQLQGPPAVLYPHTSCTPGQHSSHWCGMSSVMHTLYGCCGCCFWGLVVSTVV